MGSVKGWGLLNSWVLGLSEGSYIHAFNAGTSARGLPIWAFSWRGG